MLYSNHDIQPEQAIVAVVWNGRHEAAGVCQPKAQTRILTTRIYLSQGAAQKCVVFPRLDLSSGHCYT